ncbi:LysR family hydrogen peroxide-inducible transcriptional activator [Altererythrobacter atlanticus]|uniref:Hydrogen peroxide-inducible genes activator n=1 Tax=Croceibacterium atlanticum TaxID=1267766 RepID=A0A0F7KPL6_9SPHN|nr:hydrogen peroxide-inducible genes activator [Croceibacterium atlanticum]AKH42438.1 Hydrogen peroxide-inducible genes activator [Croceibacterium atlanticum]MBB5731215.1 LysR family hydrogen peroxide-inducible transcriptional activator [Croceibacterium atlanticum]
MPTLRQLQYLVAVADARHFSRAAASVNVSQPTLSQQLRALETRLGVSLVERGDTPVQLTPVGREIAMRARKILLDVEDLRGLARRSVSGLAGAVRFGVTPTLGPYLLPPVVARLHQEYPDMRLYMREGIPDDQLAELRRGALDLVLAPLPVTGTDLEIEPLFREPLHLVAAPDNPLCTRTLLRKTDLAGAEILSIDRRHHYHRQAQDICEDLGAQLLRDYEGTSLDSLRQMAGSGIGLAILPELYLKSEVGGQDMVCRLTIADWSATRSIAAIWRQGAAYGESYRMIAQAIAVEARGLLARVIV